MPGSRLSAMVVTCASRDHAAHNPVSQWIAVLWLWLRTCRGAAVTYLSHNAPFQSKEQIAPSNRGSKHFPPESKKGGRGRLIGQTKGGMNTKRHAVTEGNGRPVRFFITAGQISDYTGAAALMHGRPEADWLLADRGYDADWF